MRRTFDLLDSKAGIFSGLVREIIPDVHKIAVLRPLALGDLCFGLPALQALRNAYPRAEIVYLGSPWMCGFLDGRSYSVDRCEAVPQAEGVLIQPGKKIDPQEQEAFFERMQAEKFDLAVQLMGGGHYSNPFTKELGARVTIGARAEDAILLDRWIPYIYYQSDILRNLEIVGLAGAHTDDIEPHLKVLSCDREAAAPFLSQLKKPFIVVHPGSTDSRRRWTNENYARVADAIIRETGMQVVLTGVEQEADQVRRVVQVMNKPAINLCGKLSLPAMLGLLSEAELLVTNNTGPLHLHLAIGGKAVGLFFVEQLVNTLPPYRAKFHPVIAWNRRCPECGKYCDKAELDNKNAFPCKHEASFMQEVHPPEVIQAVKQALSLP